jgi:plastocyanin domain-containing protein
MVPAMRAVFVFAVVALVVSGCEKSGNKSPPKPPAEAPITSGSVGGDGVRRVAVVADNNGYTPSTIQAKPNEKLILVVTRTVDGECLAELKAPDGTMFALPKGKPVEVPITAAASGEVSFACGMDMFKGTVLTLGGG